MKKILLILLLLIFTTGCYDYIELNELSIIEGIGIDKENNNYRITLEVLINEKNGIDDEQNKSAIVTGYGSTIASAISNAADKTSKSAYFSHLKVVLINDDLNEDDIAGLTDYFLRSTEIRNEFFILTVKNYTCEEIYNFDKKKIISDEISSMLVDTKRGKTIASPYYFEEIIERHFNKMQDPALNIITIKDDELVIDGMALYEIYKIKDTLSTEESKIYNILFENSNNIDINFDGENDITLSIYDSEIDKYVKNNKLYLDIKLKASILEYNGKKSLKDDDNYIYFNKLYSEKINNKIYEFYKKILNNNTDILGIEDEYYLKYKSKVDWRKLKYSISTNLIINKEGLIYNL